MCAHTCTPTTSPPFCGSVYDTMSEPYCSSMAIKPCHFVTLESASCSSSRDCLAKLLGISSEDFEQALMGCRDTVKRPFLYPPPFFFLAGNCIFFFFFPKHIVILCLKFLKLGEKMQMDQEGRQLGGKIRGLVIN